MTVTVTVHVNAGVELLRLQGFRFPVPEQMKWPDHLMADLAGNSSWPHSGVVILSGACHLLNGRLSLVLRATRGQWPHDMQSMASRQCPLFAWRT